MASLILLNQLYLSNYYIIKARVALLKLNNQKRLIWHIPSAEAQTTSNSLTYGASSDSFRITIAGADRST